MSRSVYIASSWKNQHAVELLTAELRRLGIEVFSFVEAASTAETFRTVPFDEWCASAEGQAKFYYDVHHAMTAGLVIYIGPSGTDAWAEAGAAYGAEQIIIGLWAKGEPAGLMRRMVSSWFNSTAPLLEYMAEWARAAGLDTPSARGIAEAIEQGGQGRED